MASPEYDSATSRADARRRGVTDGQLHRQPRRGELLHLHRRTYLSSAAFASMDAERQHLARVPAAVAAQRTPTVISHQPAALLLGLPLWNVDLGRVHLTQSRGGAGLAAPELQCRIVGPDGIELGRTDFGWLDVRLLGEFDGMSRYGRLLTPGRRPEDAFVAERVRQDALHDVGYEMVRWTWADLARPDRLYRRIRAAQERAARLHGG